MSDKVWLTEKDLRYRFGISRSKIKDIINFSTFPNPVTIFQEDKWHIQKIKYWELEMSNYANKDHPITPKKNVNPWREREMMTTTLHRYNISP